MTRDTALAIWYRRLDPGCFTSPRSSADADTQPAMEAATGNGPAPEADIFASTTVADHWPTLAADRRAWPAEPVADRM